MSHNLVIGSNGFVGKSFVKYLEYNNNIVSLFDISTNPSHDARYHGYKLKDIDNVYILAWDVGGSKYLYEQESQLFQLIWNIDILRNTIPQLVSNNVPFLFISSQLADCDFVYGITKKLGETWTSLTNNIAVRLWNVYGAYEEVSERSHVVGDFITQALTTGKIKMLTNGKERRQLLYIDDVCSGFKMAMENGHRGNIYDLSPYNWIEVREIADLIAKYTSAIVIEGSSIGKDYKVGEKEKVPGWKPLVNIDEGIIKTIALYRNKIGKE